MNRATQSLAEIVRNGILWGGWGIIGQHIVNTDNLELEKRAKVALIWGSAGACVPFGPIVLIAGGAVREIIKHRNA